MKALLYVVILVILITAFFIGFSGGEINQPIRFNHNRHVESEGIDCKDCHQFYESQEVAGIPSIEDCKVCHSELVGENPEEKKLVNLIKEGNDLHWQRVFQIPRHVYFSHRRHIVLAQLKCEACHESIKKQIVPSQKSYSKITMQFCIDCHTVQHVSNECLNCHR